MKTLAIDGASIAYFDTGAPSAGAPTALLVHGFPLSHAMWRRQIDGLRETARVIAPDLRGFGESTLGDWPGAEASLDRYADDLAALLAEIEPAGSVTLAGFSMGGYIALAMQRLHADRFDRLALVDTRAAADADAARATRLKMAEGVGEWGSARVAAIMRPNLFAAGTDEAVVQETVEVISATDPAAIAAAQRAMASRPDSTPLLPSIDKPTLVLTGAEDAITPPEEARETAASITGARFVEVPAAGHMAPVEQPDAVTDALRELLAS